MNRSSSVASVSLLGLDPSSFRLVTEGEMQESLAPHRSWHEDGEPCQCEFLCCESEDVRESEAAALVRAGCF